MNNFPYLDLWTDSDTVEEQSPDETSSEKLRIKELRNKLIQQYPDLHTEKFPIFDVDDLYTLQTIETVLTWPIMAYDAQLKTKEQKENRKNQVLEILVSYGYDKNITISYTTFMDHYNNGCSFEQAFLYLLFDRSIPRRKGQEHLHPMDRLNQFASANTREDVCTSNVWFTTDHKYKFIFDYHPDSGSHDKLQLGYGRFCPDFTVAIYDNTTNTLIETATAEEKPCIGSPSQKNIDDYKLPSKRYNAKFVAFADKLNVGTIYLVNYHNNCKITQLIKKGKFKIS